MVTNLSTISLFVSQVYLREEAEKFAGATGGTVKVQPSLLSQFSLE